MKKLTLVPKQFDLRISDYPNFKNGPLNQEWFMLEEDVGSWDGPTKDWQDHHRVNYFVDVKAYRTVITAGANLGLHVRAYAHLFNTVYAFEPDWQNFCVMSINNPFENVIKINGALSNHSGFCRVKTGNPTNRGSSTIVKEGNVPIFKIDQFGFKDVDLIQLDVEGHEIEVLRGAKATIEIYKPVIIVERCNSEIKTFLQPYGYEFARSSVADSVLAAKEN